MNTNIKKLHNDQSGAIMMGLLAAFLIVFMAALTLWDAGKSARDKVDSQIAADTAAYSQAAIKSRTMNMIAYGNVAKRMFYAFDTMYVAAFLGMIEAFVVYVARCASFDLGACIDAVGTLLQIITELAEFVATNSGTLGMPIEKYARAEVVYLDNYQGYFNDVGPWWAWSENISRGMRNGATLTSAWPPPSGNLSAVVNAFVQITNFIDPILGSNYGSLYPATGTRDELPIEKDESRMGHLMLCAQTMTSFEYILMWVDHVIQSEAWADDALPIILGYVSTPLGCLAASATLGDEVLPYDIKTDLTASYTSAGSGTTSDDWLEAMSNLTLSYKMDPDRWGKDRQKFNYMKQEYKGGLPLKPGGYFTLARSEMSYQDNPPSILPGISIPGPISSGMGRMGAALNDVFNQPNMWAPRWTARMRPIQVKGETVKPFNAMLHDMLPYILLTTPLAFANSPSSFSLSGAQGFGASIIQDWAYLELTSRAHSRGGKTTGFVK